MIEAALLALDLLVMVYCSLAVIRVSKKPKFDASDLGVLAYKENPEKPQQ